MKSRCSEHLLFKFKIFKEVKTMVIGYSVFGPHFDEDLGVHVIGGPAYYISRKDYFNKFGIDPLTVKESYSQAIRCDSNKLVH